MNNSDKIIEILLRENQNFRNEQTEMAKIIHTIAFSFLAILTAFCVAMINSNGNNPIINQTELANFAFLISQIEFFVLLYAVSLSSDIATRSAYISYIETELNQKFNTNIIFWESMVSINQRRKGVLLITQLILGVFYCSAYVLLMVFSFDRSTHNWFFWLQLLEVVVILFVTVMLFFEYERVRKFIKSIHKSNSFNK